jgi:MFS family permease
MAQIRHALKVEREISEKLTFFQLWSTPGNLKRLRIIIAIAIFSQWSGNGLGSYYINLVLEGVGITSTRTKAAINGGLQCWNLACAMTAAFLVDWVGRRPLFITSTAGMFIVFSMWTLTAALFDVLHKTAAAKATVPLIFVYYWFYDICFTPLLVAYTLEILPYGIRARGFALMNITVQFTLAFNEFVNPWALDAIGWKYYLFYCGWLLMELLFVLRYIVETKGRTLEETAALFDGEKPQQDLARLGGDAAMNLGRGVITFSRRTEKSTEYSPEILLELRPSYASQLSSESQTDSRRQSLESSLAVEI